MKLTIGQKILLSSSVAMLCMVLAGLAAYQGVNQLTYANGWVRHTFLVIAEIEGMRANLLRIESGTRAYAITGDEQFVEDIQRLSTRVTEGQKQLRFLTSDNASQQSRIGLLDAVVDQRLTGLSRLSNSRREKGFSGALAAMQQTDERKRSVEILNLLSAIENEEVALLAGREQRAAAGVENSNRIILFGNLTGLFLVAAIGVALRLSITHRLSGFQQVVTAVEGGDLTLKSVDEDSDELGKLARGLNQIVSRLRNMAAQTRGATENLIAATVEILASAKEQSAVTGQQVAAYQETTATMQQVSQSGVQITERARQVTASAEAVSLANTTGVDAVQKANQTVEAIHEQAEAVAQNIVALSEKTQMVSDILAVVNDIAEQSHLLALNAAIEAAAAGEHGRTFSVVAGEIKNLADQSKAATVQVKSILGDIQKEINTSVMLTEEAVKRVDIGRHQADVAASAIRNMTANIDQSVQAFQQIVAGTNQQQIGFENVMQAMKDLNRGSDQASSSNRQTEKAAARLSDVSTQLRLATEGYRL
jgi:methyl-accepting chemotaxis protein